MNVWLQFQKHFGQYVFHNNQHCTCNIQNIITLYIWLEKHQVHDQEHFTIAQYMHVPFSNYQIKMSLSLLHIHYLSCSRMCSECNLQAGHVPLLQLQLYWGRELKEVLLSPPCTYGTPGTEVSHHSLTPLLLRISPVMELPACNEHCTLVVTGASGWNS